MFLLISMFTVVTCDSFVLPQLSIVLFSFLEHMYCMIVQEDVEAYFEAYICLAMMFTASDLKV